MAQREVVLIQSATVQKWDFSHNTNMGNGVYSFTIVDDSTGLAYTGKTKANAGFRQPVGHSPKKLVNVRLCGKVMTDADKGV